MAFYQKFTNTSVNIGDICFHLYFFFNVLAVTVQWNGVVYTTRLLYFMVNGLFWIKTWILQSSFYFTVFWVPLYVHLYTLSFSCLLCFHVYTLFSCIYSVFMYILCFMYVLCFHVYTLFLCLLCFHVYTLFYVCTLFSCIYSVFMYLLWFHVYTLFYV